MAKNKKQTIVQSETWLDPEAGTVYPEGVKIVKQEEVENTETSKPVEPENGEGV